MSLSLLTRRGHLVHNSELRSRAFNLAVCGGGISGLSACHYLQKALPRANITLFESDVHTGGWIKTVEKDGFLFEGGPNSLRGGPTGKETWQLIHELGMENNVLLADKTQNARRFLVKNGQLNEVTVKYLLSNYPEILLEPFRLSRNNNDESVANFVTRRFGKRFAEDVLDAVTNGVYGGGLNHLSALACRPYLMMKRGEARYGSVFGWVISEQLKSFCERLWRRKEDGPIPPQQPYSFKGGLQTFPDALLQSIKRPNSGGLPVEVLTSTPISKGSLQPRAKDVLVEMQGALKQFDHLFVAVNPQNALDWLPSAKLDIKLFDNFFSNSIVQVWFGWRDSVEYSKVQGFGYLIPANEGEMANGVVFHHNLFQSWGSREEKRLCVMMGGHKIRETLELDEDTAIRCCRSLIKKHLSIDVPETATVRHSRLYNCIPHYLENHIEHLDKLQELFGENVSLLGAGYYGVSVHNCIQSASASVKTFVQGLNSGKSPLVSGVSIEPLSTRLWSEAFQ